ncbi:unnamed protein product, partial [Symbiodinium microadriaticum]
APAKPVAKPQEDPTSEHAAPGYAKEKKARTDEEKRAASLDAGLRRVCTPKKSSGKLDVAPEVYQQWKRGGADRKLLLEQFVLAGANKDAFIKRIEHIRTKTRTSKLTVESGWYTKENMKKVLGWRDKYQRKLKEFWVDTSTRGTFEKSHAEALREALTVEGTPEDVVIGGVNPGPGDDSEHDSTDDDDDSEDDADSGAGKSRKAGRGKGSGANKQQEVEEEKALEAVENVGTVMANILRTQGRMEDTSAKLQALKSEDATKFLSKRCVTVVLALL